MSCQYYKVVNNYYLCVKNGNDKVSSYINPEERIELTKISSQGSHKSQKVLNALILLNTDENQPKESRSTNEVLSKVLQISMKKIDRVKKRFVEDGLNISLYGHPHFPE